MSFMQELKRRNVVRVGIAYLVSSWLLLQLTEVLYELLELPVWAPRLVILLLLIGFIPALIFAWVFEMTDEGIKREKDLDRSQSITKSTGRKLDRAIIVALALALSYFVLDKFWDGQDSNPQQTAESSGESPADNASQPELADDTATTADRKSIAVLPFANRSPNPDDAYFADGVHDDLLTHLSKIGDLHVISRTSVMGYAQTEKSIPTIGSELNVATIMEGAVQRAGDRVRINVQLIDAETDAHLWAEIYDRELTAETIFDIQSEITQAIAAALNAILSDTDQQELSSRPTHNLEAYEAYMRGRLLAGRYLIGQNALLDAMEQFDKAIELDPEFGQAYAFKSYTHTALYWYTATGGDALAKSAVALQKAEELAPDAVETLTARGYYYYWGFLDYPTADSAFDKALERSPNFIEAISGKAFVARRAGRTAEALTLLKMGRRLDPLNADLHSSIAETLTGMGRFDEALEAFSRARKAGPDLIDPAIIALTWESMGDAEKAWKSMKSVENNLRSEFLKWRVYHAIRTRDPENIRWSLDHWPEDQRRPEHAPETYEFARARAMLSQGQNTQAQELLLEIRKRIESSENPYPEDWQANALYFPVTLPGLLGDLAGIEAAIADYETRHRPDAWAESEMMGHFARALIRAGEIESALDRVDRMVASRGPWIYLSLSIDPFFDPVRDHPRYIQLKQDYESWAAN